MLTLSRRHLLGFFSGAFCTPIRRLLPFSVAGSAQQSPGASEALFELDFNNGFRATRATGDPNPIGEALPQLVDGPRGHAARFPGGQPLRYSVTHNLNPARGAIAMWIQSPLDGVHDNASQFALFAAGTSLRLVLGPTVGVRADMSGETLLRVYVGAQDAYFLPENVVWWQKGEWHHILLNWDSATGRLSGAVDGRIMPVLNPEIEYSKIPIWQSWQPQPEPEFSLGGGAEIAMDEVRIFDRPLTADEARSEFLRLGHLRVVVHALDSFLFAGKPERCRLVFENQSDKDADLDLEYNLSDVSGRNIDSGKLGKLRCPAAQHRRLTVTLRLPSPGEFKLSVRGDGIRPRLIDLIGVPELDTRTPAPADHLQLVAEVSAQAQKHVLESAPSRLVSSPLGVYREAGSKRNDRFLLGFVVKDLGQPHVAVMTIPDDKPRTMEVVLQRLTLPGDTGDYQAQTGIFTGDEFPLSNHLVEHKVLFWPTASKLGFTFMTAEHGYPAAVEKIRIYRLADGLSKLSVRPFHDSVPARQIGIYYEDPVLHLNFSADPLFPGFQTAVDRLIDYMEWFGQDTLHYPMVWYSGPLYGSDVEPFVADIAERPHPYDYPRYLMKRLQARGMTFNGGLHIHGLASVTPYAIIDENRVLSGEETAVNMQADNHLLATGYHNEDPLFNPLDPHVQAAVKAIVAEIADRYGDEPAFTGLTLVLPRHKLFSFGSIASGYNDINLQAFQRETGIWIPVDRRHRQRFSKSYEWLMANARQQWIAWRCRKIHDYYKELAGILSAKRKDLKLTINLFPQVEPFRDRLANYALSKDIMAEIFGEAGLDPNLYAQDSNIVVSYTMVPADFRFYRSNEPRNPIPESNRTAYIAPEVTAPLRSLPNGAWANFHDRYFEDSIGHTSPIPGLGVTEVGWRVSTLNPNSFHSLEYYVLAANNFDALDITKGGYVIGTLGTEQWVGGFARAFRALPAVRFDDVGGLEDPVRVRQAVVDGKAYFYILNCVPVAVDVSVELASRAQVMDLVLERPVGGSGCLQVRLQPYELRSYVSASGQPAVLRGAVCADVEFVRDLEAQVRKAESRAAGDLHLKLAQDCLSQGRYSRLFRLLQESWNHASR
jgi:hypothetical protein